MTTKLDVINIALAALGEPSTRDILSTEKWVRRAVDAHDRVVLRLLEQHPWNFAEEVAQLTATAPTPIDFEYGYNKPADCLRINYVSDTARRDSAPITYKDRGGRIVANSDIVILWYVSNTYLNLPGAWPELFADAVGKYIAIEVGPVTTASNSKDDILATKAVRAMRKAQQADAQGNGVWKPPPGRYITTRYSLTGRVTEDG